MAKKKAKKKAKKNAKKNAKISQLEAAIIVLREAKEPMTCGEIMEKIRVRRLWKSKGKTPKNSLYSLIFREIQNKGSESRFRMVFRGAFELVE